MRELNQKIFEIAGMENPDTNLEYDNSISIGQVITDQYLEEKVDLTSAEELSREEANKVINFERESIYGKENTNTSVNINLKDVFTSGSDKSSKGKIKKKSAPQIKKPTGKIAVKKGGKIPAKKKAAVKKGRKSSKKGSNNSALLAVLLIVILAALYFMYPDII